ncbi:MAG: DUF6702 family protein [Ferruginibacter sp.]
MAIILFKWLMISFFTPLTPVMHPIYVSVTEIEHNAKANTLEISCKIFTDDFEKALRKNSTQKVDLLNPVNREAMNTLVSNYVKKHLVMIVNGIPVKFSFLGYEAQEEGIVSFYQVDGIKSFKEIKVQNDILFDQQPQQINLLHVMVNGKRKSIKLENPQSTAVFNY